MNVSDFEEEINILTEQKRVCKLCNNKYTTILKNIMRIKNYILQYILKKQIINAKYA